jgi:hypothetical protein
VRRRWRRRQHDAAHVARRRTASPARLDAEPGSVVASDLTARVYADADPHPNDGRDTDANTDADTRRHYDAAEHHGPLRPDADF